MEFYDLIKNRVSIRAYKNIPVSMDIVQKIIEAARMAPSWANRQCWRFLIVDSRVEKNLIGKSSGQANIAEACEDAPYVLVLCANTKESGSKNGMEYYMFDCGLAMENLILAARNEGLSTCIIGWFDEKAIRGVLNIPDGMKVVAFTPLGYGDESVLKRTRKKQNEVLYHNYWGREVKSVDS